MTTHYRYLFEKVKIFHPYLHVLCSNILYIFILCTAQNTHSTLVFSNNEHFSLINICFSEKRKFHFRSHWSHNQVGCKAKYTKAQTMKHPPNQKHTGVLSWWLICFKTNDIHHTIETSKTTSQIIKLDCPNIWIYF